MALKFPRENCGVIEMQNTTAVCFSDLTGTTVRPMENFKTLRLKRKRSQKWIAAKIGRHFSVVSQYENGRTKPSVETLEAMAKALRVSMARLSKAINESHRLAHAPRATVTNLQEAKRTRRESQMAQ